jgi:putative glutamine amidotransferase
MPQGNNITEEDIFRLRHPVTLTPGGLFQEMVGKDKIIVNSLHGQGIDQLGRDLVIQAISDDNIIEGISIKNHPSFGAAVQWHTEFHPERKEHTLSRKLYEAFGRAAKQRMQSR